MAVDYQALAYIVVGVMGTAATVGVVFITSGRNKDRMDTLSTQVTPNGTGHTTMVSMIEDVLKSQGKQEAWMDQHAALDLQTFGGVHEELEALKVDVNDHLRPNVHTLINQITAISGVLQLEDTLNRKLAEIKAKQAEADKETA